MIKMANLPQVDFPPPELSTSTRAPLRPLPPVQNFAEHYFVCLFVCLLLFLSIIMRMKEIDIVDDIVHIL